MGKHRKQRKTNHFVKCSALSGVPDRPRILKPPMSDLFLGQQHHDTEVEVKRIGSFISGSLRSYECNTSLSSSALTTDTANKNATIATKTTANTIITAKNNVTATKSNSRSAAIVQRYCNGQAVPRNEKVNVTTDIMENNTSATTMATTIQDPNNAVIDYHSKTVPTQGQDAIHAKIIRKTV